MNDRVRVKITLESKLTAKSNQIHPWRRWPRKGSTDLLRYEETEEGSDGADARALA